MMVVDDFYVVRITLPKLKANPPRSIDSHSPLALTITFELVKSDTLQWAQIFQGCCGIERRQKLNGRGSVKPSEL